MKSVIVEQLIRKEINTVSESLHVYCFNGKVKVFIYFFNENKMSIYDDEYNQMDNILEFSEKNIYTSNNDLLNQTFDLNFSKLNEANKPYEEKMYQNTQNSALCSYGGVNAISMKEIARLSEELSQPFRFVRVDWMIYQNRIYFEELTFTPYSGFHKFQNKKNALKLGKLLNLGDI